MIALTDLTRTTQRVICLMLATIIVAASLSVGVIGAQAASHSGYSVTITQIQ